MTNEDCILTTSEVAELIKRTPALVRYLEDTGKLKAHKTPRGVRVFHRRDVELFLAARASRRAEGENRGRR